MQPQFHAKETDHKKGKWKKESERERSKQIHKNKTSPNFGLQCMQMPKNKNIKISLKVAKLINF